jgi:DNA-binding transcriptional MocR family regulator
VVDRQRRETASRQKLISDVLPGAGLQANPAGLDAWLSLPRPWRAGAFCFELLKRGVSVTPAESFAVDPAQAPQAVRLCLGAVESTALRRGLEIVSELLRSASPPGHDLL